MVGRYGTVSADELAEAPKIRTRGSGYLGVFQAPDRWIGNSALSATSSRWLVLKSSVVCNWALFWKIDTATDRKNDKSLGEVVG